MKLFSIFGITLLLLALTLGPVGTIPARASSISPTYTSNLLTDGGMELWNSTTDLVAWTEAISGTSSVNQETPGMVGTYALRFDVDGTGSNVSATQTVLSSGSWYITTFLGKRGATSGSFRLNLGSTVCGGINPGTTWISIVCIERAVGSGFQFQRASGSSANASFYFDDVSTKQISLASTFGDLTTNTTNDVDVQADLTIPVTFTQAGVVAGLNSATAPTSFIIAYHNGTNIVLDKCVNGTYTNLISTAVAYSAGATLQLRKRGTTYSVYYGGSQRGTDQTISDASMGTLYGAFSTYAANSYANFAVTTQSTATPTQTPSQTFTPSYTPTASFTPSNTFTPSYTPSRTHTPSFTPSTTYTPSQTASATPTDTPTDTPTFTPTDTPTPSQTYTPTVQDVDYILIGTGTAVAYLERRIDYGQVSLTIGLGVIILGMLLGAIIRFVIWYQTKRSK